MAKNKPDDMPYKDRDWLYEAFYVQKRRAYEIGQECGVAGNTVLKFVKKFEIPKPIPDLEVEVELLCSCCKAPFTRTLKNLLQRSRQSNTRFTCSHKCAATLKMQDPEYAKNLHEASRKYKASDEGKEMMRKTAVKSNLKQAVNRGRTSIEQKMAEELDRRGIKYIEQRSIGNRFVVDFFLPDYSIALEADGDWWHSSPKVIEKDRRKDAFILSQGFTVYRFLGSEINKCVKTCVDSMNLERRASGE